RADAARRAAAEVLLLLRPFDHFRGGGLGARDQGADPEARLGGEPGEAAHGSGDREHPQEGGDPDREAHRREVPRPARDPLGENEKTGVNGPTLTPPEDTLPSSGTRLPVI